MKCCKCGHEMIYGSFPYCPVHDGTICAKCFHGAKSYEEMEKEQMLMEVGLFDDKLKNMTIEDYLKGLAEYVGRHGSNEISGTDCEEAWLDRIIEEYYYKMKSENIL